MKKNILYVAGSLMILGGIYSLLSHTNNLPSKSGVQDHLAATKDNKNKQKFSSIVPFRSPAQQNIRARKLTVKKASIKMRGPSTSHPELDRYTKLNIGLQDLYLLSELAAEYKTVPASNHQVTELAGYAVYEGINGRNSIIYDESRGLYGIWNGIITLSAPPELVGEISNKYSLSLQQSIGSTHFFTASEGFDLVKNLPELKKRYPELQHATI